MLDALGLILAATAGWLGWPLWCFVIAAILFAFPFWWRILPTWGMRALSRSWDFRTISINCSPFLVALLEGVVVCPLVGLGAHYIHRWPG